MGRIYRVVHEDFEPDTRRPQLLKEPANRLVTYLDHPNGWWRDQAQQLLIVRNDRSVLPALRQIASGEQASLTEVPSPLARIHALWTLEGMEAIDKGTLFKALEDADAQVRKTAVWISEYYLAQQDKEVISKLASLQQDPSADVRIQLSLSLRSHPTGEAQ